MSVQNFFRYSISLSLKTSENAKFGEGFNCNLEIGSLLRDRQEVRLASLQVVKLLDHRAIGLDVNLGVEPTPYELVLWVRDQIHQLSSVRPLWVRLKLGESLSFESEL